MKRILILSIIITIAVLLTGCFPAPAMDTIEDVQIKIIGVEQEVYCGAKAIMKVADYKCPPQCPECDSCCPECETCETCEICETCQTCPEVPECPNCPCYGLKWGNLFIDLQLTNQGNVDSIVNKICVEISFEDGTKTTQCVDTEYLILIGETRYEQVEFKLSSPIKKVVLVELINEIVK